MIWFEFLPYNTFTDRLPLKPINRGIQLMNRMMKNFIDSIYLFPINCLTLLKLLHSLGVAGTKSYKQIFFMKNHSFFYSFIYIKCIATKRGFIEKSFFFFFLTLKVNPMQMFLTWENLRCPLNWHARSTKKKKE